VKTLPSKNAALLSRRPADVEVICEYAAEAIGNGRWRVNIHPGG